MKKLITLITLVLTIGFVGCLLPRHHTSRPVHKYFIEVGEVRPTKKANVFMVRAINQRTRKISREITWRVTAPSVQVGDRIQVWEELIVGPRF